MKKLLSLLLLLLVVVSCGEYQKALKSDDIAVKYAAAEKMYDKGKYEKAIRLFEQLAPAYRGKPQAEKMFYMFAQSYYKTNQFHLASYQFESFASSYPKSEKAQEAAFLGAKSYSQTSSVYSLDQTDTYKAIDKLQSFIDKFPNSDYLADANLLVKGLQEKLERKAFENAKGYHTVGEYNRSYGPAIVALENFIIDYPGTPYKEQALYYKFDSAYRQALNSIESKRQERLFAAKNAYSSLLKHNPNTEYKAEVDQKLAIIEKELQQYANK